MTPADLAALVREARTLVEHPERDRADFLRRKAEVVARVERDL